MFADKLTAVIAVITTILAGAILVMHLVTHTAFFDETIHVRYLWYLSSGLRPNVDFFCLYPTLGYILSIPFMRLLPESPYIVLALRCISVVVALMIGIIFYRHGRRTSNEWVLAVATFLLLVTTPGISAFFSEYSVDHFAALTALGALLIFFTAPEKCRVGAASVLCLVSVFIMPKYALPLFFGMLGYLSACYLEKRCFYPLIAAVAVSSAVTFMAIMLLFILSGDSLGNNIRYAFLLNFKYNSAVMDRFGTSPLLTRTALYVADFYWDNALLAIVTGFGISGWIYHAWCERGYKSIAGGGILLGVLVSAAMITVFCEQYITPVVLCLAMFVPFMTVLPVAQFAVRWLRFLFVSAVFITLLFRLASVAEEFKLTPLNSRGITPTALRKLEKIDMVFPVTYVLKDYAKLMAIIPAKERVVAAWPYHPLLRRDLTFHIYDDRPSLSNAFDKSDPLLETFSPKYFRAALESTPPALIVIPGLNNYYPPGWQQEAKEFLERHKEHYVLYSTSMIEGYVRRDLLGK